MIKGLKGGIRSGLRIRIRNGIGSEIGSGIRKYIRNGIRNEMRKAVILGAVVLAIMSMSGCGKDTSIVDNIAKKQDGAAVQAPSDVGKEFRDDTEETETTENKEYSEIDTEAEGLNLQRPEEAGEDVSIPVDGGIAKDEIAAEGSQRKGGENDSGIDVDLTKLSSTMVYSEVYNMMNEPETYVGKTIKIEGVYYASYWQDSGKYYHCVLISDATACCQNGIEFVWDNDTHIYPDEYPPDNTLIELTGVFELYEENGETYCRLRTDDITVR